MIRNLERLIFKNIIIYLLVILIFNHAELLAQDVQEEQLENLFQWAVMDFQNQKYRQVISNLEPLLRYFDEQTPQVDKKIDKNELLKGRINLLLGATYEHFGSPLKARTHYKIAQKILDKDQLKIEGLDLSNLEEYQRIVKDTSSYSQLESNIIEKPVLKSKRKSLTRILLISGATVVVGVMAAILLKKKKTGDRSFDTNILGISWAQVGRGPFFMGDNFNEGDADELPERVVWLDEFSISMFEITFRQYDYFCEETHREKPDDCGWGRDDKPVINVSWEDANAFCEWLSSKTGKIIQLPTEAQWEKAAKGTSRTRYPWGDSPPDCEIVNFGCTGHTQEVSLYSSGMSTYSVYNIAGNVSEWCRDIYEFDFYTHNSNKNPYNEPEGDLHVNFVVRGGSWNSSESPSIRCSDRGYEFYNVKKNTIGFRIVKNSL